MFLFRLYNVISFPDSCKSVPNRMPIEPAPRTAIRKLVDLGLASGRESCALIVVHFEDVLRLRKCAGADLVSVTRQSVLDIRCQVCISLGKFWHKFRIQSQNVMQYEHLTVTIPARADPNCWYRDVLGYKLRGFFRDHFQNDPEHTCLFQCLCVPHHFLSSVCGSALDPITSV